MKNFIISIFFTAILSAGLEFYLPWWVIVIVSFAVGYVVQQNSPRAFLSGFWAIFILWVVYAYLLSHANNDILARKVAILLPLKGHVSLLLLATGVVGGFVSGLASLSGRLAANLSKA